MIFFALFLRENGACGGALPANVAKLAANPKIHKILVQAGMAAHAKDMPEL
jgi:hypothetical protein